MNIGYSCISETKLIRRLHRVTIPVPEGRSVEAGTVQEWLAKIPRTARLTELDVRDDDDSVSGVYLTFTEEIQQS